MTDNKNLTESPDFVQENDKPAARTEVTIKFGRGLIGDPFTSKNGKELVEVKIPNADKSDTRPWGVFRDLTEDDSRQSVWQRRLDEAPRGRHDPSFPHDEGRNGRSRKACLEPRNQNRFQL